MLSLAVALLRRRWAPLASAFAALAVGAALVAGVVTILVAVQDVGRVGGAGRFAAAPIVVTGPADLRKREGRGEEREVVVEPNPRRARVDPALVATLAALPEVRQVVVDRTFPVRSSGGGPTWSGHPWSSRLLTPYRLVSGRAPDGPLEVAASAETGLRVGAALRLATPAGSAVHRVVALLAARRPASTTSLFFLDAAASTLRPRIDAVAVWPLSAAPAVRAEVARAAGGSVVLTGARRAEAEPDAWRIAATGVAVLLGVAAMTVGFVAVFAIASAFAFAVALRRRELGLLRALGAGPRQVRRLVLCEAAVVASAASAAGAALSPLSGWLLVEWLQHHDLLPAGFRAGVSLVGAAGAAALVVVVALCGAWLTARRAGRVGPAEALRDAAVDRGVMTPVRWLVALAAMGGAAAALTARPSPDPAVQLLLAFAQTAALILAVAMAAPVLVGRLLGFLTLPLRRTRGAFGVLVAGAARSAPRRTAALAAPVVVAVGLTGSLAATFGTLDASDRRAVAARFAPGSVVVRPPDERGLSVTDLEALRAIPSVRVGAVLDTDLRTRGHAPFAVSAVDRETLDITLRLRVLDGRLQDLRGPAIALGQSAARALGKRVGDRMGVWLPDGTRHAAGLRVVAVLADGFGATSGWLPRGVLRDHVGGAAATEAYVVGAPAAQVRAVADARGLESRLSGGPRQVADPTDSSNMNPLALQIIVGIAVLYVAIGLAGTAAVATSARARELGALRLAGAGTHQRVRILAAETAAVVGVGGLLGLAIVGVVVAGLARALDRLAGPTALATGLGPSLIVFGAYALIAVTATVMAAYRTAPA